MERIGTSSDKRGTKKKTEEIMGNGETDLSEIYFLVCFKQFSLNNFELHVQFIGASLNINYDKICQRNAACKKMYWRKWKRAQAALLVHVTVVSQFPIILEL